MGQMAVCCQNLTLGALSSSSALSVLVGMLFKKFGLFLNTPCISYRQKVPSGIWSQLTSNEDPFYIILALKINK